MSNTERQRQFRERHPGYYQRLHAQRRAAICERVAQQAALAQAQKQLAMQIKLAEKPMLMLPAPAVMNVFDLNLPIQQRERVAIPLESNHA
jgi:hypothetical protein